MNNLRGLGRVGNTGLAGGYFEVDKTSSSTLNDFNWNNKFSPLFIPVKQPAPTEGIPIYASIKSLKTIDPKINQVIYETNV